MDSNKRTERVTAHCALIVLMLILVTLPVYAQSTVETGTRKVEAETQSTLAADETDTLGGVFTHRYAFANGVRLHYVIGGQGDPLVLLHGWPQTWYEWHRVMPALAQSYTVIVPDLRGAGLSGKPSTGYDKLTMANDIYALITHLRLRPVNLVGHDIGGMVGYALAAAHPEAVRRFAILDVPLPGIEVEGLEGDYWHFGFHQATDDLAEQLVRGRERIYLSWFYRNFAYNPNAITPEEINRYARSYSDPRSLHAGFEWYRAFPEDARQNQIFAQTKLRMPVLALGGEKTAGTAMVRLMQVVADDVQGGSIEQCGHWIPDEKPEELVQRLLSFF